MCFLSFEARLSAGWCPLPDSNRHPPFGSTDFKSVPEITKHLIFSDLFCLLRAAVLSFVLTGLEPGSKLEHRKALIRKLNFRPVFGNFLGSGSALPPSIIGSARG